MLLVPFKMFEEFHRLIVSQYRVTVTPVIGVWLMFMATEAEIEAQSLEGLAAARCGLLNSVTAELVGAIAQRSRPAPGRGRHPAAWNWVSDPPEAAEALGVQPGRFTHPRREPLERKWVAFSEAPD